jgi:hypothetical protein
MAQKARLLETIFGVTETAQHHWPGSQAYLRYLEEQFAATGSACFKPLWSIFGLAVPVETEDLLDFIIDVAGVIRESREEGLSIDEILQSVLTPLKCELGRLDAEAETLSRQAVFKILSWLTMIFKASNGTANGFQIDVPLKGEGIREEQSMDKAKRPISRLIRGFGQLLPSTEQVSHAIEKSQPDLIYAASLNVFSLKMIDKIRIEWTSSLGCHLMFNPLRRTLTLYRFPTFCAMSCAMGNDMVFDK